VQPEFVVVYDVLEDGISGMRLVVPLAWFVGLVVIGGAFVIQFRQRAYTQAVVIAFSYVFWSCAGMFGVSNVVEQQVRCMNWARSGTFDVVEGEVRQFQPASPMGKGYESFSVSGIPFRYSNNNLSRGGFHNVASRGGPMRPGLYVRIAHREGRILKIEVRQ
jgi:hypothetical protein